MPRCRRGQLRRSAALAHADADPDRRNNSERAVRHVSGNASGAARRSGCDRWEAELSERIHPAAPHLRHRPGAPGRYRVLHTAQNQQTYQIAGVAPGTYSVFAIAYSLAAQLDAFNGAYTRAVACGLSAGCTDHTPIAVQVRPGVVADGVDLRDWYAPPGTYPRPPTDREPFKSGDQVVVDNPQADEVNARDAASLRGKILRALPNGTQLTIQGGPVTADGYDWYPTQIAPDQDIKNAFVAGFALRRR